MLVLQAYTNVPAFFFFIINVQLRNLMRKCFTKPFSSSLDCYFLELGTMMNACNSSMGDWDKIAASLMKTWII